MPLEGMTRPWHLDGNAVRLTGLVSGTTVSGRSVRDEEITLDGCSCLTFGDIQQPRQILFTVSRTPQLRRASFAGAHARLEKLHRSRVSKPWNRTNQGRGRQPSVPDSAVACRCRIRLTLGLTSRTLTYDSCTLTPDFKPRIDSQAFCLEISSRCHGLVRNPSHRVRQL